MFEAIRRERRDDPDVSIRELAARHGVHRRTVRQALASAEPPPRKVPVRTAPVLDPVKPLIDAMLRQDLDAPRKQRHTALRVRERLLDEHQLVVAYSTVRDYEREARPRIAAEAGKQLAEVFVPQTHPAGAEAEVDFADLWIVWAGVKTKVFLFTLRLSYSGKAIHRAYATASQEAFLDGHRYAFEQLGGIPTVHIRYDNLKAAVSRVLTSRTRVESDRWVLFRSHYGFDVGSTCSVSTSSATSNSTGAAPNCCSRSSPNAKRRPPSRSPPTNRSAAGPRPSPTPACAPRSSTGSPTTPPSSRPVPPATASHTPAQVGPTQAALVGPSRVDILTRPRTLAFSLPASESST